VYRHVCVCVWPEWSIVQMDSSAILKTSVGKQTNEIDHLQ
jgi:hypothetical protein